MTATPMLFAIFTQALLAQAQPVDPVYGALVQAGVLGAVVLWFMWRDGKERLREESRQAARDAGADRMAEAINNLAKVTTESHNYLVRSILIEATSRPNIAQRAKDEAESILVGIGPAPRA